MKKGKAVPAPQPLAAMLQRRADERLREIAANSDVAERYVLDELGEVAATNLRALSPERRTAAALEVFKHVLCGMRGDDATAWLAIKVQEQRLALERKATAASEAKKGRSRGGAISAAKRQAPWGAWRAWVLRHFGAKPSAAERRDILDLIAFRANAKGREPKLNKIAPETLPPLGRQGRAPSSNSIRRNLFGTRAK